MPRWLSSLLIIIGFFALILLAVLPRNVTVIVDIDSETTVHHETTTNHNGPVPTQPAGADESQPETSD